MFSWIGKEKALNFNIKFLDSYLMKCLYTIILPNLIQYGGTSAYHIQIVKNVIIQKRNLMASLFIQEKNLVSMIS